MSIVRDRSTRAFRAALEDLRREAIRSGAVDRDPLGSVLSYSDPADQEVGGLLSALLAYGRVDLLRAHVAAVLSTLGDRPARALRSGVPRLPDLRYRFHRSRDLAALLRGIRTILLENGTLGEAFAAHWAREGDMRRAIAGFAGELRGASGRAGPGLRFLLADPALGGACKRWNLYLRWMVRCGPGDPDPGPWSDRIPASSLIIPLDTHVARVGRRLGLTRRRTPNWKMATEITDGLRKISPEDPVRYDFPLCHLGISGACPPRLTPSHCARCPLAKVCPTGQTGASRSSSGRVGQPPRR